MTTPEYVTLYGLQLSFVNQLAAKSTRSISDVIKSFAVKYMAATGSTIADVQKFDTYARALNALTTNIYANCFLTAKTDTNETILELGMEG